MPLSYLMQIIKGRRHAILYLPFNINAYELPQEFYDECRARDIKVEIVTSIDKRSFTIVQIQQDNKCD